MLARVCIYSVCWTLGFFQGDICTDVRNDQWLCQECGNCPKAQEELSILQYPVTSVFNRTKPTVPDKSQEENAPTAPTKSKVRDGDFCKIAAGASWTCETVKNCPKAATAIKEGEEWPEICGLNEDQEVTVCCEPEVEIGAKSIQMCKKYAESVFIHLEDGISDGGIRTYDTCGFKHYSPSTPKVKVKRQLNSTESKSREYPHMALLGYRNKTSQDWKCGGTLISERFVLTSAQCTSIAGPPLVVRLGDLNIQSETDEDESVSQPTDYEIVEIIKHPDFKPPSLNNDIALLKLDKDAYFTEFIRPICLQTDHRLPTTYALITGWGNTVYGHKQSNLLQTINISLYTQEECNIEYKKKEKHYFKDGISEATMICAGNRGSARDTCRGDSGGPLQIPLEEPYCMYSQLGLTSFGKLCELGVPTVHTRVSHFVPWIESIVWP